jgi:hypothetical protein
MRIAFIGHLLSLFLIIMAHNIMKADARKDEERENTRLGMSRNMLGGYKSSENTKSKEINHAVNLVLHELQLGKGPTVSYSSQLNSSLKDAPNGEISSLKAVPLKVSQQVVAGLNFKMKIGFFLQTITERSGSGTSTTRSVSGTGTEPMKHKHCIGGISATVYRDLKGEYTITKWGKEIECSEVVTLLNEHEGDE